MRLLDRLDRYATDEPGFHEGLPEDRCPLCDHPVVCHVGGRAPDIAKWPHRWHALFAILVAR